MMSPPPPGWKRLLAPITAASAFLFKYFGVVLKFLPVILKTGSTMILSIGVYTLTWGWQFALGFVMLMFVHECGHLLAARSFGLKVGAPMFVPFMGALIALRDRPHNAWIESCVGIGGPLLGSVGALGCDALFVATDNPVFRALAYSGFFLNLFNLIPIGFLDGGRIATALSPWLWVIGFVILGVMVWQYPSFLLVLILASSLPRIWSLFQAHTEKEERYFEMAPIQRVTMAVTYFALVALLVAGMHVTHIDPDNI